MTIIQTRQTKLGKIRYKIVIRKKPKNLISLMVVFWGNRACGCRSRGFKMRLKVQGFLVSWSRFRPFLIISFLRHQLFFMHFKFFHRNCKTPTHLLCESATRRGVLIKFKGFLKNEIFSNYFLFLHTHGCFSLFSEIIKKSGYSNCSCSSIQNVCIFFHTKTAFFSWFFSYAVFQQFNLDGLDMMLGFCFLLSCWFLFSDIYAELSVVVLWTWWPSFCMGVSFKKKRKEENQKS